jgi:hypothetical protein
MQQSKRGEIGPFADGPSYFEYAFESAIPFFISWDLFLGGKDHTGSYDESLLFSGTESVQNAAASKWAARRLAGRMGVGSTRHMVYTPALPKPTHATPMPALAMANSVHPSQSCCAVRVHLWRINLRPQYYCRPWGRRSR